MGGADRRCEAAAAPTSMAARAPLRRSPVGGIAEDLHILRAPLGGLFRHVLDIAHGQTERGHRVGLIVDSTTGGARADAVLAELAPRLALGIQRVAIARELGLSDVRALRASSPAHQTRSRRTCFTATAPRARRWRDLRRPRPAQSASTRRMAARWSIVPARSAAASIARWNGS